ncbi:hypothetical protein Fmac_018552 [Flemingia macrophylla]|uniref:Uncharacterized protein n=1 Tax=Flemingia macrophylla TaxID=520843 RepID=A0ABD1M5B3_9FABA
MDPNDVGCNLSEEIQHVFGKGGELNVLLGLELEEEAPVDDLDRCLLYLDEDHHRLVAIGKVYEGASTIHVYLYQKIKSTMHGAFENQSPKSRHAYNLHVVDTVCCTWASENWKHASANVAETPPVANAIAVPKKVAPKPEEVIDIEAIPNKVHKDKKKEVDAN